jgi:hypothetical protein
MEYSIEELNNAREIINQKISDERTKLEAFTLLKPDATPEQILIEGETEMGYYCQIMVDPRDCAPILLKYDYPIYKVLQEEFPEGMWEELGRKFGIKTIMSVDL